MQSEFDPRILVSLDQLSECIDEYLQHQDYEVDASLGLIGRMLSTYMSSTEFEDLGKTA